VVSTNEGVVVQEQVAEVDEFGLVVVACPRDIRFDSIRFGRVDR